MSDSITGGCRCGAIRYECNAEPILAGHCYCTVCQRASGTDKNSAVASPEDAFRLTGGITEYTVEADSATHRRAASALPAAIRLPATVPAWPAW